jgi:hypothetical protein
LHPALISTLLASPCDLLLAFIQARVTYAHASLSQQPDGSHKFQVATLPT